MTIDLDEKIAELEKLVAEQATELVALQKTNVELNAFNQKLKRKMRLALELCDKFLPEDETTVLVQSSASPKARG